MQLLQLHLGSHNKNQHTENSNNAEKIYAPSIRCTLPPTRGIFDSYNIIAFQHMYNFRILRSYFSSNASKQFLTSTALLEGSNRAVNTRNTDTWHIPRFCTNYKFQSLEHNLPVILNEYQELQNCSLKESQPCFVQLVLTHGT